MAWSHGLESWIGVMEWNIGVDSWSGTLGCNFECNRKLNSGGEICLGAKIRHDKMCNKCINCTSKG